MAEQYEGKRVTPNIFSSSDRISSVLLQVQYQSWNLAQKENANERTPKGSRGNKEM